MSDFPTSCYGIKNNIFNTILVHANKFVTCLSFYNEVKLRVGFREVEGKKNVNPSLWPLSDANRLKYEKTVQ